MTSWMFEDPPRDWVTHLGPDGVPWAEELESTGFRAVVAFHRPRHALPAFTVGEPARSARPDPAAIREMLSAQTMVDDDDDDIPPPGPPGVPAPDRMQMERMLANETLDDVDDDDEPGVPAEIWFVADNHDALITLVLDGGRTRVAAVSVLEPDGCVITEISAPGMPPSLPVKPGPTTHRAVHTEASLASLLTTHTAFASKVAGSGQVRNATGRADAVEAKQRLTGTVL